MARPAPHAPIAKLTTVAVLTTHGVRGGPDAVPVRRLEVIQPDLGGRGASLYGTLGTDATGVSGYLTDSALSAPSASVRVHEPLSVSSRG